MRLLTWKCPHEFYQQSFSVFYISNETERKEKEGNKQIIIELRKN